MFVTLTSSSCFRSLIKGERTSSSDELTCYMFANIIQAGAISSHVHDFPDTFCARYYGSLVLPSPQYYELFMKKNKSALESSLEILHPFLDQISEFRAPCFFGKYSLYWLPSSLLLLQPQSEGNLC